MKNGGGCYDLSFRASLKDENYEDELMKLPECCSHCHGLHEHFGDALIHVTFRGESFQICCRVKKSLDAKIELKKGAF